VSYGEFVAYTTVFLDLGGWEMSVDLKLLLSLVEVVAEDGSCFSSFNLVRRESANVNRRVRFRGGSWRDTITHFLARACNRLRSLSGLQQVIGESHQRSRFPISPI